MNFEKIHIYFAALLFMGELRVIRELNPWEMAEAFVWVCVAKLILDWLKFLHAQLTLEDSDIWMDWVQELKADKREWCTVPRQQGVPRQIPVEVLTRENLYLPREYVAFLSLHHHHLPYLP